MGAPKTKPAGLSGVRSPSGYLQTREHNVDLRRETQHGDASTVGQWERLVASDPVVASCVQSVVLPIAQAPREILPPEGKLKPGAKLDPITEFVRYALTECLKPGLPQTYGEIVRAAIVNGCHVVEPVFRRDDAGQIVPRCLEPRPAWSIRRWLFEDGELAALEQGVLDAAGVYRTPTLEIADVLLVTHDRQGSDPTGRSMLRPVYRAASTKDHLLKLMGMRNEREALGVPIVNLPQDRTLSEDEMDALTDSLKGWRAHEEAYLLVPFGCTVQVPKGEAGASDAIRGDIAALDHQIRSAFLQGFQSLGGEGASSGGFAVGTVQAEPYYLALMAIDAEVRGAFDTLIERLVVWNFGPQEKYPYLSPAKIRAEDVVAALAPLATAIEKRLLSPDGTVDARARELLSLPPPEEDTEAAKVEIFQYDQDNGIATIDEIRSAKGLGPHPDASIGGLTVPEYKARFPQVFATAAATSIGRTEPQGTAVEVPPGEPPEGDGPPKPPTGGGSPAPGKGDEDEPPASEQKPDAKDAAAAKEAEKRAAGRDKAEFRANEPGVVALAFHPPRSLSPAEQRVAFGEISERFDAAPKDLQTVLGGVFRRNRSTLEKWARKYARGVVAGDAEAFKALARADLPKAVRAAIVEAVKDYAADMVEFGRRHAERERSLSPAVAERRAHAAAAKVREAQQAPAPEVVALAADDMGGEEREPSDDEDDYEPSPELRKAQSALETNAQVRGDRVADDLLRSLRLTVTTAAQRPIRPGVPARLEDVLEEVARVVDVSAESMKVIREIAVPVSVEAVAVGRRELMEETADEIASVAYSAVMDAGTCAVCAEWDEKTAPSWDAVERGEIPPTPNPECMGTAERCRCIHVAEYR